MNQDSIDQGWQRLQQHSDNLIRQFLRNDYPAIEYKSRSIALLQLPAEYKNEEMENIL
jgi:hypothetical protein